jgi:hypothetical protein
MYDLECPDSRASARLAPVLFTLVHEDDRHIKEDVSGELSSDQAKLRPKQPRSHAHRERPDDERVEEPGRAELRDQPGDDSTGTPRTKSLPRGLRGARLREKISPNDDGGVANALAPSAGVRRRDLAACSPAHDERCEQRTGDAGALGDAIATDPLKNLGADASPAVNDARRSLQWMLPVHPSTLAYGWPPPLGRIAGDPACTGVASRPMASFRIF